MVHMRHSIVPKVMSTALVCLLVVSSQFLPHAYGAGAAKETFGACSSGLCGSMASKFCPAGVGADACAGYSQCASSDGGPFICTPQQYCDSAGCGGIVNGGTCH